jgi:hypothetical protein
MQGGREVYLIGGIVHERDSFKGQLKQSGEDEAARKGTTKYIPPTIAPHHFSMNSL